VEEDPVNWADPDKLQWLWFVPLLAILFWLNEALKRRAVRRFARHAFLQQLNVSLSRRRRFVRILFLLAGLSLLVTGFARPQGPGKKVMVTHRGVDIVIAIDVSDSMLTEDIKPNRLEKAKLELQDLVDTARGDKIGVVAFAGDAHGQVPLTLDRAAVKLFLKALTPGMIPVPGTAIGRAIHVSMQMFDLESEGDKVIILLTDGEDHEAKALEAAKQAADKGVHIFTVGIGSIKGDLIPVHGPGLQARYKTDLSGNVVVSKLGEETLLKIAQTTGGAYYRSRQGPLDVDTIYRSIRSLQFKETGSGWVTEVDPQYQMPVLAAFVLFLMHLWIGDRRKEKAS